MADESAAMESSRSTDQAGLSNGTLETVGAWKSYAAWWGLFTAWLQYRGVQKFDTSRASDELKNLVALLLRKYAYSTLNILVNAVNAVIQDAGYD